MLHQAPPCGMWLWRCCVFLCVVIGGWSVVRLLRVGRRERALQLLLQAGCLCACSHDVWVHAEVAPGGEARV